MQLQSLAGIPLCKFYYSGPAGPGPSQTPPGAEEGSSPPVATGQAQLICFRTLTTNTQTPQTHGPLSPSSHG